METTNFALARRRIHCINCTLRNGNRASRHENGQRFGVLIVPCGMETVISATRFGATIVLIVPCGMETIIFAALKRFD